MEDSFYSVSEVKNNLGRILDQCQNSSRIIRITKRGKPYARLMSEIEYESILYSLELLSNKKISDAIRQGVSNEEIAKAEDIGIGL